MGELGFSQEGFQCVDANPVWGILARRFLGLILRGHRSFYDKESDWDFINMGVVFEARYLYGGNLSEIGCCCGSQSFFKALLVMVLFQTMETNDKNR